MVPSPKPPSSPLDAVSEAQKKEHEKPKNHRNERRNASTTSVVDAHVFFSSSRTEKSNSGSQKLPSDFASKSKKTKQVSVSVDQTWSPMLPKKRKRKNSEEQKQSEEKSEVSVELFTSSLVMYPCKGNKLFKTSEENLPNVKLSTKLMLRDKTWPTKDDTKTYTPILSDADMREALLAYKIGLMKNYRPDEVEHERRTGVSTKLKLVIK